MLPFLRRYWYVLLLVFVILGGIVGILFIQKQLGRPLMPTNNLGSSNTLNSTSVNSRYGIAHLVTESPPSDLYILSGYFSEPLFYQNDVLMGNFILDDEPNKSSIRILFSTRESNFAFGRNENGGVNWTMVQIPEIQTSVRDNTPVEIRISLSDSQPQTKERLETLINDDDVQPLEYGFAATMVREK